MTQGVIDKAELTTQDEVNKAEWKNPDNWGGPKWLSVYFSKKDSRVWVPKQLPWMGWTLNLAKTYGVFWLIVTMVCLSIFPVFTLLVISSLR